MLLEYGNAFVSDNWYVTEKEPTRYSRVYFVHGGDVTYTDQYTVKKLKKNYVYILPSTLPYTLKQNKEDRFCCTFVHIDFVVMFASEFIEIEVRENTLLHSLLHSLKHAIDFCDISIIIAISETFELYCKKTGVLNSPPGPIAKAIEYIFENFRTTTSILTISSKLGYNEQYFIRMFKKHIGVSPYQFLMDIRFKESLRLFKLNYKVSEVATLVGYQDLKTFCRAFKAKYGFSPKKYKLHILQNPNI